MQQRIVFLDRASLQAEVRRPSFAHQWQDYAASEVSELPEKLADATVAITNKVPLRAATLRQLPNLKMIAVAATGYDVIDIDYCKANGIAVSNIRNYAVHTVPEHAFALILALRRNLFAYRADVANGRWGQVDQFCFFDHPIRDMYGATLGIIGEGALGQATAKIARGFGMKVLFADHAPPKMPDVEFTPFDEVLSTSDVISLHAPLTPDTRNLIGIKELRKMKRTAILINTSRGGLVDEQALVAALTQGLIGGAGFDVLTKEPPKDGNPLLDLRLNNFILTPHVAWASDGAMQFLADQLVDNIEAFVAGKPQHLVTLRAPGDRFGTDGERGVRAPTVLTVGALQLSSSRTILPCTWLCSSCCCASRTSLNGNTAWIRGITFPASIRAVISRSSAPSGCAM
jgi:glycerate dehydrogenase